MLNFLACERRGRALLGLAIALSFFATPAAAQTEKSVVVLGFRSLEGDDEMARNLTAALRNEASKVPTWRMNAAEVSLAQMMVAHGCEEPSDDCMSAIAESLGVDLILHGNVRRTDRTKNFRFLVMVHLYDHTVGRARRSTNDWVPRVHSDIDHLRERAAGYLRQVAHEELTGTLKIVVDIPGATVSMDGYPLGYADPSGEFYVRGIEPGARSIEVTAQGYPTVRRTVRVIVGQERPVRIALRDATGPVTQPVADEGGVRFPTYLMLTLSVGLIGAGAYSWIRLGQIERDLEPYRRMFPASVADICPEAERAVASGNGVPGASETSRLCKQADTWEVLQWVFLGGAVLAGTTGTFLLIRDLRRGKSSERPSSISVRPSFGPRGGRLDATFAF